MYNPNENRLEDIKELVNEANQISERIANSNLVACADEDRISDIVSELFTQCHIDWLIEQSEKIEGLQREIKKCYRDIEELQQDKRDLEKLVFDLGKEIEQLRKMYLKENINELVKEAKE